MQASITAGARKRKSLRAEKFVSLMLAENVTVAFSEDKTVEFVSIVILNKSPLGAAPGLPCLRGSNTRPPPLG